MSPASKLSLRMTRLGVPGNASTRRKRLKVSPWGERRQWTHTRPSRRVFVLVGWFVSQELRLNGLVPHSRGYRRPELPSAALYTEFGGGASNSVCRKGAQILSPSGKKGIYLQPVICSALVFPQDGAAWRCSFQLWG